MGVISQGQKGSYAATEGINLHNKQKSWVGVFENGGCGKSSFLALQKRLWPDQPSAVVWASPTVEKLVE